MMVNSDNARAQSVRAYFGQAALNATAASLGLTRRRAVPARYLGNPVRRASARQLSGSRHTPYTYSYLFRFDIAKCNRNSSDERLRGTTDSGA